MDALNFKLKLKVPESSIVNSLISLVHERVKRLSEMLAHAKTLEISLFQHPRSQYDDACVVAEITLAKNGIVIKERSESKMWDVAFLNALDLVKSRLEHEVHEPLAIAS